MKNIDTMKIFMIAVMIAVSIQVIAMLAIVHQVALNEPKDCTFQVYGH